MSISDYYIYRCRITTPRSEYEMELGDPKKREVGDIFPFGDALAYVLSVETYRYIDSSDHRNGVENPDAFEDVAVD